MVVVVTVVKISVHSSMCSDGDDITFVMKVAMFKLCLFISQYCNVFSYCDCIPRLTVAVTIHVTT